jgi:hypothetical protein
LDDSPNYFLGELFFENTEAMLYEIADKDITKFKELRKIKRSILYKAFYIKRLEKLNELIGMVNMLKKNND